MKKRVLLLLLPIIVAHFLNAGSSRTWAAGPILRRMYSTPTGKSFKNISSTRSPFEHLGRNCRNYQAERGYFTIGNSINNMRQKFAKVPAKKLITFVAAATLFNKAISWKYNQDYLKKFEEELKKAQNLEQLKKPEDLRNLIIEVSGVNTRDKNNPKLKEKANTLLLTLRPQEQIANIFNEIQKDNSVSSPYKLADMIIKLHSLPNYKETFAKLKRSDKDQLLEAITKTEHDLNNILEELTTEPGWFWGRRKKIYSLINPEPYNVKMLREKRQVIDKVKSTITSE